MVKSAGKWYISKKQVLCKGKEETYKKQTGKAESM